MTDAVLPKIPRLIRNCRLGGSAPSEPLLLMPEGVLRLSETAAAILELCDGKRCVREIIEELRARYSTRGHEPVGEMESEVLEFLQILRDKRVVDFGPAGEAE